MKWVVDKSIYGKVWGENKKYKMWIELYNRETEVILNTIAHELAHIHAYEYHRKEKGDNIFYSHGALHKQLEKYYVEYWYDEIRVLYNKLWKAKLDFKESDAKSLASAVASYIEK